jgi:mono/diheme cytochrome c family protein
LRDANVAHGDLQHGNVLLVSGGKARALGIKLVDYDGLWVPALAGQKSFEVGHPAYQHPQRLREGTYSLEVDRFSHLVIYTALCSLALRGRPLWERYDNGDNLLFCQQDFQAPGGSALFRELLEVRDPQVCRLAAALAWAAQQPLEQTPLLEELAAVGRPLSLVGALAKNDVSNSPEEKGGVLAGQTAEQHRSDLHEEVNAPVCGPYAGDKAEWEQRQQQYNNQWQQQSSRMHSSARFGLLACAIVFLLAASVIGTFVVLRDGSKSGSPGPETLEKPASDRALGTVSMPRRDQSDKPVTPRPPDEKPREESNRDAKKQPAPEKTFPLFRFFTSSELLDKAGELKSGEPVVVKGQVKGLGITDYSHAHSADVPPQKHYAGLSDKPNAEDQVQVVCVFPNGRPEALKQGDSCQIVGIFWSRDAITGVPYLVDCELVATESSFPKAEGEAPAEPRTASKPPRPVPRPPTTKPSGPYPRQKDVSGLVLLPAPSVRMPRVLRVPLGGGGYSKTEPSGADFEVSADQREAGKVAMAAVSRVCAQCHTGQRSKGDSIIFTSPGQFNQNAPWAAMKKAVEEGKMPPPRSPNKLTPEEATAIRTWIVG